MGIDTHTPVDPSTPTVRALNDAMELLGIAVDPLIATKDHVDRRQRAELIARIAAHGELWVRALEEDLELGVDDRVDLHWQADREVASARLLELQQARIELAGLVIARAREGQPSRMAEAITSGISAVLQLLQMSRDGRDIDDLAESHPLLADSIVMLTEAATKVTQYQRDLSAI